MAVIYVVEDDESIREIETIALKNSGHEVIGFSDATTFLKRTEVIIPDLVLLDIMLPDLNGNEIVKKLKERQETKEIPIIMVTAKTTEIDLIKSLDGGADDYIKKPFSVMELITRVKVLLRRTKNDTDEIMKFGNLVIDHVQHEALLDGKQLELTYKEYELLRYLAANRGAVLSRGIILQKVWDVDFEGETRTVDMHIKTLRKKLGEEGEHIKTVRNVGYMFE